MPLDYENALEGILRMKNMPLDPENALKDILRYFQGVGGYLSVYFHVDFLTFIIFKESVGVYSDN